MSIYFGSINHIQKIFGRIQDKENIKHILIESSGINFIDLAGVEMLVCENKRLMKHGGGLYFVGLKPTVNEFAIKSHFIEKLGDDHFFEAKSKAVEAIYARLDKEKCASCQFKIFDECHK